MLEKVNKRIKSFLSAIFNETYKFVLNTQYENLVFEEIR